MRAYFNQHQYSIKFEWGLDGVHGLAPESDVLVIIDVMSFSSCVDVVLSKGAVVLPYVWKDECALEYAQKNHALLANPKRQLDHSAYSLSPQSLLNISFGTRIVLPSPNGSSCAFAAQEYNLPVVVAGLRNASASASFCQRYQRIGVIACGERWPDTQTLRPAIEDYLVAGKIIAMLLGGKSPEALLAQQSYSALSETQLTELIWGCGSAIELIQRGFRDDVGLCAQNDVSDTVCLMVSNEINSVHKTVHRAK